MTGPKGIKIANSKITPLTIIPNFFKRPKQIFVSTINDNVKDTS